MKPEANPVEVSGTTQGEDIAMGIAQENMSHVAGILTNMYADRIAAVIREYATNALDAHRDAGYPGPVEVITPTKLRPTLSIRDYGPGLSREDVRLIYSQYGSSTKRENADANGMLGIGSKSGLTYAESFTVVSIQGGRRLTVLVFRGEDGAPVMRVLDEQPTDDASGVEVQIPCRMGDAEEFQKKAHALFRFWERGSVTINDKEPEPVTEYAYRLTDDLYIVEADDDWTTDLAVMAGVAYPTSFDAMPTRIQRDWRSGSKRKVADRYLIAFVETGSLTFAPSREALMDTQRTQQTVAAVQAKFQQAVATAIQRDVDAATNRHEAMLAYADAKQAMNLGSKTPPAVYDGMVVPEAIKYPDPDPNAADPFTEHGHIWTVPGELHGSAANRHSTPPSVPVSTLGHTIWVTNFTPSKFSKQQRERLEAYRRFTKQPDTRGWTLVNLPTLPMPEWVQPPASQVWDWQEVRKWRDPNAPTAPSGQQIKGSYPVQRMDGNGYRDTIAASDIPDHGVFYHDRNRYPWYENVEWLRDQFPDGDWVYVGLTANRLEKFRRDFPHAVTVDEAQEAVKVHEWSEQSEKALQLLAWTGTVWDTPAILLYKVAKQIEDPELREQVERHAAATKAEEKGLDPSYAVAPANPLPDHTRVLQERYPLLDNLRGYPDPDDVLHYVNAAHAARKRGSA